MKLMRAGFFFTAVLLAAPSAWAGDKFASAGTVAIGAERLFGIVAASDTREAQGMNPERTSRATSISLLSSPISGAASNYSFARVGVDFFPIDGLSVGAAVGVFSVSTSSTVKGASPEDQDGPTLSGFVLAPRVGFGYMFMDLVGIWPRLGITYVSASSSYENPITDSRGESSSNRLALSLDVPIVIVPVTHAAIMIGPTLDLGLSGGNEASQTVGGTTLEQSEDAKATDFGLQAGIAIAF